MKPLFLLLVIGGVLLSDRAESANWKPTIVLPQKKKKSAKRTPANTKKKKEAEKEPSPAPVRPETVAPLSPQTPLPPVQQLPTGKDAYVVDELYVPPKETNRPLTEYEVATKRAKAFLKTEQNLKGKEAALSATVISPEEPNGWLLLGVAEQRLENDAGAIEAFEKYLELDPNGKGTAVVKQRITEMKLREEARRSAESKTATYRFGGKSDGIFLAYSPVFKPLTGKPEDLGSDVSFAVAAGFRPNDQLTVGFKFARGAVSSIGFDGDGGTFTGRDCEYQLYEAFVEPNLIFNQPYRQLGIFQPYIPIHVGIPANRVTVSGKTFWNIGASLGAGVGLRAYTTTTVMLDVAAQYVFGFPFWGIRETSVDRPVRNASGASVQGRITGLDVRLTLTVLLPY